MSVSNTMLKLWPAQNNMSGLSDFLSSRRKSGSSETSHAFLDSGLRRNDGRKYLFSGVFLSFFGVLCACSSLTPSDSAVARIPYVLGVEPEQVAHGETLMLYGSDFSESEGNVVLIGETAIVETDWELTQISNDTHDGTFESVSFVMPDQVPAGVYDVRLLVGDAVSNAVTLTVME